MSKALEGWKGNIFSIWSLLPSTKEILYGRALDFSRIPRQLKQDANKNLETWMKKILRKH